MHTYLTLQGAANDSFGDGTVDEDSLCGSVQQDDSDTNSTSSESEFDIGERAQ